MNSLKISRVAHHKSVQEEECWTWNQMLIRGLGSIRTGGNNLLLTMYEEHAILAVPKIVL